jgi:hypothetical protein
MDSFLAPRKRQLLPFNSISDRQKRNRLADLASKVAPAVADLLGMKLSKLSLASNQLIGTLEGLGEESDVPRGEEILDAIVNANDLANISRQKYRNLAKVQPAMVNPHQVEEAAREMTKEAAKAIPVKIMDLEEMQMCEFFTPYTGAISVETYNHAVSICISTAKATAAVGDHSP